MLVGAPPSGVVGGPAPVRPGVPSGVPAPGASGVPAPVRPGPSQAAGPG
ncbi:hypothetical protein GCM10010502_56040 [Kitasatospora aureofaciens]|uniref:Uncharacterized protein n=1 Tax=Kitasatospora aureofaciens TaxID=1894 RepID=A0A8H9HYD6_KITAU|nr:hypothetical protein GCM10010502_56040 [Kitasatospora aureofaciens]